MGTNRHIYRESALGERRTLTGRDSLWYSLKWSYVPRGGCWGTEPSGDTDPGQDMKQVSKVKKKGQLAVRLGQESNPTTQKKAP